MLFRPGRRPVKVKIRNISINFKANLKNWLQSGTYKVAMRSMAKIK